MEQCCALVYSPFSGTSVKLMYGRAFRAPNAIEAFNLNYGSDDIKPETVDLYGVSVAYTPFRNWQFQGSYFYADIEDFVYLLEDPATNSGFAFKNVGTIEAHGVALEFKGMFRYGYLWGNYSVGYLETELSERPPGVAEHLASGGIHWNVGEYAGLNMWSYVRGGRFLVTEEAISKTDPYTIVNANLRMFNLFEHLEAYITAYNILDIEYVYPGIDGFTIPARGREFIAGIRHRL